MTLSLEYANERYVPINNLVDYFHKDKGIFIKTQEELTNFNNKNVGKLSNHVLKILCPFGIKHDQTFLICY